MCEPYHSVVQYPTNFSDDDLFMSGQMDNETRIKSVFGRGADWLKKIKGWFHFSSFGAGHHWAIPPKAEEYLPKPLLYEGEWWNRKFAFDGYDWPQLSDASVAAAREYHNQSAMGNVCLFRRFLETSMLRSKAYHGASTYVTRLIEDVLTTDGVNKLLEKFRRVFGKHAKPGSAMNSQCHPKQVKKGVDVVMGFVRKRVLFLPHFADDAGFWRG